MLGQLYRPKGKALDTARAVLECDDVYACNVAKGCTNQCSYCWLKEFPYFMENGKMEFPKRSPVEYAREQIEKGLKPEGIFLSFLTDLFLSVNLKHAQNLICFLLSKGIEVATLTKSGIVIGDLDFTDAYGDNLRMGISIVSLDNGFRDKHEPHTRTISCRLDSLKILKRFGYFVWVSIEPYPTPDIWKQDLIELLEELSFADFLLFGKWNYNWRAENLSARIFYRDMVDQFTGFCKENKIRHFVKPDTLKFIGRR